MWMAADYCTRVPDKLTLYSTLGALNGIYMQNLRQMDIDTGSLSALECKKRNLLCLGRSNRGKSFPGQDVNGIDPEAEVREGWIGSRKVWMQSK